MRGIHIEITSSRTGLIIFAIAAGIRKHRSITKTKKKKHDKIALLEKTRLNGIEVLISKALIGSYISHNAFVLVNNVIREYDDLREEIKNLKLK